MAIQDDNTILNKGDLKAYHEAIAPMLGGTFMVRTNNSDYYSTDEKIVGVWTDGRPVYQKTFTGNVLKDASTIFGSISDLNIDVIVASSGHLNNYNGSNGTLPVNYSWAGVGDVFSYYTADNNIYIYSHYTGAVILTLQYTKTTDTAGSATTTPGAYDINFPNTWPENTEIYFGNGLYGKRFTGTFTSSTSFNSNIAQLDTIDRGTTFKFINRGGNIFRRNDTAMPLGIQDTLQYDIWYANSSSGQNIGLRLRGQDNGTYSCSYDVWVTYKK